MIVYTMRDEPIAVCLKEMRMAHLPTVLAYAMRLSQIKRIQAIAA
jgi:hypothetical protein